MKKVLSVLLCCIMAAGLLAACGGGGSSTVASTPPADGGSEPGGDTADGAVDYSEHEEFTIWMYSTPNDFYADYSDNPVMKFLEEKFNVTLTFQQPATGTEQDSLSLMFGTGEYTDMVNVLYYPGSVQQLYEDGVIVDIAEYLEYMPNLSSYLDQYDILRRSTYNDDGRILGLPAFPENAELAWGGMVYRHDILETMTGGNVEFPSGEDTPTTLEDWDYMLPLFKAYFDAAGMPQSAPLILPYNGYFAYSELVTGFGFHSPSYYIDNGVIKHGLLEEGAFNYLKKMNEWYEAGYIYSDFASRTNDMFFLPNTELTYGGAAGIWYGLPSQLGDAMSMPEYGLEMEVRALSSPLDTANGITGGPLLRRTNIAYENDGQGAVITNKCTNVPKLLSIIDYLYSEEGSMAWQYGLTKEQIPAGDEIYAKAGIEDGFYWFEGDDFVYNPVLDRAGGAVESSELTGRRLPGFNPNGYDIEVANQLSKDADAAWCRYDSMELLRLPTILSYSLEDENYLKEQTVLTMDYLNSMFPKFIMGTEPLTEESFNAFVEQMKEYGIEKGIELHQDAYDRYMQR